MIRYYILPCIMYFYYQQLTHLLIWGHFFISISISINFITFYNFLISIDIIALLSLILYLHYHLRCETWQPQ
jgi:hypothetical protein